jgi:hypothetical protein
LSLQDADGGENQDRYLHARMACQARNVAAWSFPI